MARSIRKKDNRNKYPADIKDYFQPHIIFDSNIK